MACSIGHHHKCQDPHQHQGHRHCDNGRHRSIVALVRAKELPHATPNPAGGPPHVHNGGLGVAKLQAGQVLGTPFTQWPLLHLLLEGGEGEAGLGAAVGASQGLLQDQFSLAALEAHRLRSLHIGGQLAEYILVGAQMWQVPAVGQIGEFSAHRAGQGFDLG